MSSLSFASLYCDDYLYPGYPSMPELEDFSFVAEVSRRVPATWQEDDDSITSNGADTGRPFLLSSAGPSEAVEGDVSSGGSSSKRKREISDCSPSSTTGQETPAAVRNGWPTKNTRAPRGEPSRKRKRVAKENPHPRPAAPAALSTASASASASTSSHKQSVSYPVSELAWQYTGDPHLVRCLWLNEDGGVCSRSGSAEEVWAHICADHHMGHLALHEEGCAEQGTAEALSDVCAKKHVNEFKMALMQQEGCSAKTQVKCPVSSCKTTLALQGLPRHVSTVHFQSMWHCDLCTRKIRFCEKGLVVPNFVTLSRSPCVPVTTIPSRLRTVVSQERELFNTNGRRYFPTVKRTLAREETLGAIYHSGITTGY
ncbi:hypothetical protein FOMPIDRAFT_1018358 [Fomitopsis schrenkii]|uniref:Uncharacterized protein n=1 Tax=Fomitopsis schrenkii TaxID=2126942 RepID=S8E1P0_FOMSC|nr:hypothetical protein FOMPIDRAFT_1018358 [Fomitopsis schrenkii]